MKDFFDTWKFKILIAIAVFLVGIMAYAGANGRLTAAPQELLSVAVAPFQRAAAAVSSGVASLWENYANIDAILEENQQLSEENASLRSQMVDYDKLKAENEAYKALANIQEQHPEMSYTSSFVIGRDPLDSFWGFTLDRGTLDGVAVTDYAADGLCILSNLARSTLSREGDQVITTGLGGVFPPDVLVGVIKELTPEASGKSTLAVIQPGADPRTVRHVFIITNY